MDTLANRDAAEENSFNSGKVGINKLLKIV